MKFRNFKDEQELMDFIDPNNRKHISLMVEYAISLHERFGLPIDMAVDEVKRLLELKKNGEKITSMFIEEFALDYKKPFEPVPRKREKSKRYGTLTEQEEIFHINNEVYNAIRAFHDLDEEDREKMEFYVKDTVEWYSEYFGIDKAKMVELLKAIFRKERKSRPNAFSKYKGKELNRMVGTPADPDARKYDNMLKMKKEPGESLIKWEDDEQK